MALCEWSCRTYSCKPLPSAAVTRNFKGSCLFADKEDAFPLAMSSAIILAIVWLFSYREGTIHNEAHALGCCLYAFPL